ncbi:hypothetical protein HNY73_016374 [Argiope bruennichi]|uniref:Uncharacterized protein n=1 Tax=Argiope bruennichi TaxID=94029 RepID=A0A8T0EJP1_ARGBR|nr:hypothetical protein HNY73_016374 [Argiope bruennichi]
MAVDLKIELFAHDLFSKIFFENGVRHEICDGRIHYVDECMMDVEDYQQRIYDDCFYQAAVCRQYFFRRIFHDKFEENPDFYTSSYSDFYDYVHIILSQYDLFGYLHLFDRMLASCAFVADLCLFCYSNGHQSFVKIAHLCWALYFDKFTEEFYEIGGWEDFRKVALAYSLPFIFLTTHIEPKMTSSYIFVSLTRLRLSLANFVNFLNSGINTKKTASKNWIEFRRNNWDIFQFVQRQYKKVNQEPQNAIEAENLLLNLAFSCRPCISTQWEMDESHSSEDLSDFLSMEEYDSCISEEEFKSQHMLLKQKIQEFRCEINEGNKIRSPKNEEDLLQVCKNKEPFHQPSEKDPYLQQISEAEDVLTKFSESDETNQLISAYEDCLKELYDHEKYCQLSEKVENLQKSPENERGSKLSEPENSSQQHSEHKNILQQVSENKKMILECYEKNQSQSSKKANLQLPEFQVDSQQDQDKVSSTSANRENILTICRDIISSGVESYENSCITAKDQNSTSQSTNQQDSDNQNIEIHRSSQLLQIQKGVSQCIEEGKISQPEHEKKDAVITIPENNSDKFDNRIKLSPLNACQEVSLSSDNKKGSSLSKMQGWISPFDKHLKTENQITEIQNDSTSQRTLFLSDNEIKSSKNLEKHSPFDAHLISRISTKDYQNNTSSDKESKPLKKCKQTYEMKERNLLKTFPTKYEIYKNLFLPRENTCMKQDDTETVSKSSSTAVSPSATCVESEKVSLDWDTFHKFFKYEKNLLRIVCEFRDPSLREDEIAANTLCQANYSTPPEDRKKGLVAPITSHDQNEDSLSIQNDEFDHSFKEDELTANVISQTDYSTSNEDRKKGSVAPIASHDENKYSLSVQNDEFDHSLKEDETTANILRQTEYSPSSKDQKKDSASPIIFHDQNEDSLNIQNDELDNSLKDEITANVVSQTDYSISDEDRKKDLIATFISQGQNKHSLNTQTNNIVLPKMEDQKTTFPINSDLEKLCLLTQKSDEVLDEIDVTEIKASSTKEKKCISAVEVKDECTLESSELMSIPDKLSKKRKKRKEKKKNRKKNTRKTDEKASETAMAHVGNDISEENSKHSTKSNHSKKFTITGASNDSPPVITETVVSSEASKQTLTALQSIVQRATSLAMDSDTATRLNSLQKNFERISRNDFPLTGTQIESNRNVSVQSSKNDNIPIIFKNQNQNDPIPSPEYSDDILLQSERKNRSESSKDRNRSSTNSKSIPFDKHPLKNKSEFSDPKDQKGVSQIMENVTLQTPNVNFENNPIMKPIFPLSNYIIQTLMANLESSMKSEEDEERREGNENEVCHSSQTLQLENLHKALSSAENRVREILPDCKSTASSDCLSPNKWDRTFSISKDQKNNSPNPKNKKKTKLETCIEEFRSKEVSEAFRKMEFKSKKTSKTLKSYQPNEYFSAKREQTSSSTIEEFRELYSLSKYSETPFLSIKDFFPDINKLSFDRIEDIKQNFLSNTAKTFWPTAENEEITEPHMKTEEKISFPSNDQKNTNLSDSIKEENIAILSSDSSTKNKNPNYSKETTNIQKSGSTASKNQKNDFPISVSIKDEVKSDLISKVEAFESILAENKDYTYLADTDEDIPSSALTYVEISYPSRVSRYTENKIEISSDFSISSTTPQQDQNTISNLSNKSSTILDETIQPQNALSSSTSEQNANDENLDNFIISKASESVDASENNGDMVNTSDINSSSTEPQSEQIISNSNVQCIDNGVSSSTETAPFENTNKSEKCDYFPRTPMQKENSNLDPILQTVDEKTFLINNILTLGIKNKRTYLTLLFEDTQL